jgi:hypothetical protein
MAQKIKISISLPEEVSTTTDHYTYHWDRIIAASVLALLLLMGAGYGIYSLFNPALADPQSSAEAPSAEESALEVAVNQVDLQTSETIVALEQVNLAANALESKPSAETMDSQFRESSAPGGLPVLESGDISEKTETLALEAVEESIPQKDVKSVLEPTELSGAVFSDNKTFIYSANISRFILADKVINKEPKGTLEQIQFSANDLAAIYAFSDVNDMKDKHLQYVWKLNNKKVAEVDIGVWSDRWRSYSSKLIKKHMHGDWQVELRDREGELLAMSKFTY